MSASTSDDIIFGGQTKKHKFDNGFVLCPTTKNLGFTVVLLRAQRKHFGFTMVLLRVQRKSVGFTMVLLRV